MWLKLDWSDPDMLVLHIQDGNRRTELRGDRALFTDREDCSCPIAMLITSVPRYELNRSALMADEKVSPRADGARAIREFLAWYDKVTLWQDGLVDNFDTATALRKDF